MAHVKTFYSRVTSKASWLHALHSITIPQRIRSKNQKSDDDSTAALKTHLPFEEAYSALRKYPLILRVTSWFRSQCNTSTLLKTVASSSLSLLSLRSSWVTWCRKSISSVSNLLIEFNLANKKKRLSVVMCQAPAGKPMLTLQSVVLD